MWKKISWLSIGCLMYLSINTSKTLAHGSQINYKNTSAVEIIAKFDNGKPMSKAQVVIYAPNNPSKPWLTGMTDENGKFVFAPDEEITGDWSVKVRMAGHGGVINIPIQSSQTQPESLSNRNKSDVDSKEMVKVNQSNNNNNLVSSSSLSSTFNNSQAKPTTIQKLVMAATGVWGFVGTALFFSRQKD